MSMFNPDDFLNTVITEASVKRPLIPVGDYSGIISKITPTPWAKNGKEGVYLKVLIDLNLNDDVKHELNLSTNTLKVSDTIMLDTTNEGTLDMGAGKNKKLRQYREALRMNKSGESFSLASMVGQVLTIKMKHELYEGDVVEKVNGVAGF